MGAARKLQGEIDRCLKKVQEGIDEFDQIWQKVHDTENANQKEKFEADLKKEIKKLQRLRDQIKSWISGADIKDKSALLEARKAIEREMERFKTCEKEAKMKQFSKAALGQADRLDPREQAKMESREWINEIVDKLNVRIEQFEYEVEELQAGLKKKAKPPPKLVQLEEVVTVHKKHAAALEKVLRCLDNDAIMSDEIDPLKEELEYYLEQDLEEHYDNTDDMYCDIADRLEAVEAAAPAAAAIGTIATHVSGKGKEGKSKGSSGGKDDEELAKEKERERERAAAAAVKAQLIAQGNSNVKPLEDDDRPKSSLPTPRPPALASVGSGSILPPSPMAAAAAAVGTPQVPPPPAAAGVGLVVPPSPRHAVPGQPTPRSTGDVPPSPAVQGRAAAAAESPADSGSATAAQNGPSTPLPGGPPVPAAAAAGGGGNAPPPPPPAAAAAAAAASTPAAGRPGVTLAALVSSGLREQQQQQQQESPAHLAHGQQQQPAAAALQTPAAAAATPSGGRLGAWMAGVPESAKQAAAAQQQQQPAQTAAAVLQKGLAPVATTAAAASGSKPGTPAIPAPQQQQQQQQPASSSTSPDKAPSVATPAAAAAAAANGPVPAVAAASGSSAAADNAAAAAAAGVTPSVLEGASAVALLEGWSRLAAAELGLGTAMHVAVPRGSAALPVLEACMRSALPQPSDSDWNKPKPRHPIVGPASYPKTQPDVISAPGLFRKMDPEALFFAFYYQPDTYQQYLAAQELKRQSWRYHKHHNAWFQRYAEPAVTTEEYEQGTYVYFDYNIMHDDLQTGWCYRRKENFTFRYDALEDELPVQAA